MEINIYQKILLEFQSTLTRKILYGDLGDGEKKGLFIALNELTDLTADFLVGERHE